MSRKNTVLALAAGISIGYFLKEALISNSKLTPDRALKQAKEVFQKNGPINGSWIYMKPEKLEKNGLTYDTYRGGISRNIDGTNKQYDFHIDIQTGVIVDSVPSAS